MKRCIYYCAISICAIYCLSTVDSTKMRLAHICNLYTAHDYHAKVNPIDFASNQSFGETQWNVSSELYELTALALGYKPVCLPDNPSQYTEIINNNPDLAHALADASICYIEIPSQFDDPLLYRADTKDTALRLLKYMMLEQVDENFAIHANRDNQAAHWYMLGKCLGYTEDDITLFFQRAMFIDATDQVPENSDEARQKFNTCIADEWPATGAPQLAKARKQVNDWIRRNTDIEQLEQDIHELQDSYPQLRCTQYDQPLKTFMNEYY